MVFPWMNNISYWLLPPALLLLVKICLLATQGSYQLPITSVLPKILPGAHKRKERVTSILYRSNQEVKSSASGCGVTQLDDYHNNACLL